MDILVVGTLMLGVTLLGIILFANFLHVRDRRIEKLVFDIFLFLISALVLFIGAMLIVIPPDFFEQANGAAAGSFDMRSYGIVLAITGAVAMALSIGKVRRLLARIMPINPGSPVHSLALFLSIYLIGYTLLLLSQGGLSGLAESAEPAPLFSLILQGFLFALVAMFGVGFVIRRRGRELAHRLGLERPTLKQLAVAVGLILILVLLQACAGLIWGYLNPDQSKIMEDIGEVLFTEIDTVWEWLILALATGISEEVLFRGALQPALGLGFTSVLFALIHIQYGFSPVTLFIVLLAIVLGLVRRYYSTTITIFIHVGYNFTLGMLAVLAAYLQDVVA
ncbi:MAG TPA: CPBP family intramembrane glutamic endopeptidase [candidate division Zixibacteria bacterium]|nr:CPBP family intramembrane glutamic endopeptidase [candidate division Zixibacteria bacterium]